MKETLHSHLGRKQLYKRFLINSPIVNMIIGDMMWDTEDIEGDKNERMISLFEDLADDTE